jgi:molecular chaperone GrpE
MAMTKNNKEENNQEIEKLKKERDEYLDGWKRARADFVNYKKNQQNEIIEAKKRERKKIILDFLEILDNFYLAEKNIPGEERSNYLDGLLNIKKQIIKILKNYGVEEVKTVGKEFDPNLHEAVAMVEAENKNNNIIVEEINKGYLLNGELLRPAKVKVAK